ncbi:MAG: S-layer homology domain-containing protein [Clostridia bacterium]|nr:S-layer homology domain-containing protein [Clostridia bacterium]
MKRKLTALISAMAVTATMMPVFTTAHAATQVAEHLGDFIKDFGQTSLAGGSHPDYKWNQTENRIENKSDVDVNADMKAKLNGTTSWKDKLVNNTYSADKNLNLRYDFDFKTTLEMENVLAEYNKLTNLTRGAITVECMNDTDGGARKNTLLDELSKSYIENAEFTITVKNPNGMALPTEATSDSKSMYGFTATNGTDTIVPASGKITIPGDPTDTEAGSLVYTEASRTVTADGLEIKIKTEGKTSHKALENALKYDLVLECDGIGANSPDAYNSNKDYKLIGTVTGNTPIYAFTGRSAEQIAYITYKAVQNMADSSTYDSSTEIAETVRLVTGRKQESGGSGGGYYPPVTATPTPTPTVEPTATPSPTLDPNVPVTPPAELNSEDHVAYIIGYPEGDVRPENNISREEVATIFYRLLTDEARAKSFTKTNNLSDVDEDRWSNNAISTLANSGYIEGYEDGTFRPANHITRAEFVTIVARFYETVVAKDAGFTDVSGHWAEDYINRAVYYRLLSGYDDGTFKPDNLIKRDEAMTIVNSILNRKVEKEGLLEEAVAKNWSDNPESAWYYTIVLEATMSHEYTRPENVVEETWTALKTNPDWVNLEKTWTQTGTEQNN